MPTIPEVDVLYAFRVPHYDENGDFSHFVYPPCSMDFGSGGDEYTLSLYFDSTEQAYGFLAEQGLLREAEDGEWRLVEITTRVLETLVSKEA